MRIERFVDSSRGIYTKRAVLTFAVIAFFCNIAVYLSQAISPHLEPQYWLGLLALLVGAWVLVSPQGRFEVLRTPLIFWCVLFMGLTLLVFILVPTSHFSTLKERIRDVIMLVALLAMFLMMSDQLVFVRKLVFWAVVIGALINLISLVTSNFLLPSRFVGASRPAGFYINPNESATALIFGMILAIGAVPKTWRIPFVAWTFVGITATFSREAILGWAVAVAVLCITGTINWKHVLVWTSVLTAAGILLVFILIKAEMINIFVTRFYGMQLRRLVWFIHGIGSGASVKIRLNLMQNAWELFMRHPWLGNGIGSTEHWQQAYSTHNMYLYYMDDYGIIGALLYPLLIWAIVHRARGEICKIGWCMAAFMLFWALFDHNVVHNYYSLFAISLMAAMSRISMNGDSQGSATTPALTGTS
jgi:O-antigen ligase